MNWNLALNMYTKAQCLAFIYFLIYVRFVYIKSFQFHDLSTDYLTRPRAVRGGALAC